MKRSKTGSRKYVIPYIATGVTLVFLFLANIVAGPVKIPLTDALHILFGKLSTQQDRKSVV